MVQDGLPLSDWPLAGWLAWDRLSLFHMSLITQQASQGLFTQQCQDSKEQQKQASLDAQALVSTYCCLLAKVSHMAKRKDSVGDNYPKCGYLETENLWTFLQTNLSQVQRCNHLPKLTKVGRGDVETQTQASYLLSQNPSTIPLVFFQDSKVKIQFPLKPILEVLGAEKFVVGFNGGGGLDFGC